MKATITIDKSVLFELMCSHSKLAQAEYDRNHSYNSDHFSAKAEELIIKTLTTEQIMEYFKFMETKGD